MMAREHLSPDCRFTPLWWDDGGVDLASLCDTPENLPARVDAAIVGGGYTGLSAALTLARAGRDVVVLDAEAPGFGCSSRNGGLVGPSFHKLGIRGLSARYGERKARDILAESMDSLCFLLDFIVTEGIECGLERAGRFRGADRARDYDDMGREIDWLARAVGLEADMVPQAEQHTEIGSDAYHGGAVYHRDGHLQPALYVQGLIERARASGVRLMGLCPVTHVSRESGGFSLDVDGRQLGARQVLVATNGYTTRALPYFRRRLVPLRSAIIATEPLRDGLMDELSPRRRGFSGTNRLVLYYRHTRDAKRMVFGGRAFHLADRPLAYSADLYRQLTRIFPQLDGVRVTHAWSGTVAYTFDHAPHVGEHDGMFFSMGYCGSGVGRATYFGRKAALKMLGDPQGRTTLDDLAFETRPFYTGYPWFLPAIIRWHALVDGLGR